MIDKIDLTDTTFLILVRVESRARKENLNTAIRYINKYFHTWIRILEVDKTPSLYFEQQENLHYQFIQDNNTIFHTTRFRNVLIKNCNTQNFIMYDTDVIIPASQILQAVQTIRKSTNSMVYPYDGRFYNVRGIYRKIYLKYFQEEFLTSNLEKLDLWFSTSCGGVFMANKSFYLKCGLENENIKSWGPDDKERLQRIKKLGYPVIRVSGPLLHLDHPRGTNSYHPSNELALTNQWEYLNIWTSTKKQVREYVTGWQWATNE
jgi:predicted glycosyltransferase involved in capsule biosynthesis